MPRTSRERSSPPHSFAGRGSRPRLSRDQPAASRGRMARPGSEASQRPRTAAPAGAGLAGAASVTTRPSSEPACLRSIAARFSSEISEPGSEPARLRSIAARLSSAVGGLGSEATGPGSLAAPPGSRRTRPRSIPAQPGSEAARLGSALALRSSIAPPAPAKPGSWPAGISRRSLPRCYSRFESGPRYCEPADGRYRGGPESPPLRPACRGAGL